MPSKMHPLQVLLPPDLRNDLTEIAIRSGSSRGYTVRALIKQAADMTLRSHPRCANGRECMVPHFHQPQPPAPPRPTQSELPGD